MEDILSTFTTPKKIILEGLKQKAKEINVSFDFSFDYPNREAFPVAKDGSVARTRRIVVSRTRNVKKLDGIGREFTAITDLTGLTADTPVTQVQPIGWYELWTIEITVFSVDARDRDNLIELIKYWMLELEQKPEPGYQEPYFVRNLIVYCNWLHSSEEVNDKIAENNKIFVGKSTFEVLSPFFGLVSETYKKYRYDLLTEVIQFPGIHTVSDTLGEGFSPSPFPASITLPKPEKKFRKTKIPFALGQRISLDTTPFFAAKKESIGSQKPDAPTIIDKEPPHSS